MRRSFPRDAEEEFARLSQLSSLRLSEEPSVQKLKYSKSVSNYSQ